MYVVLTVLWMSMLYAAVVTGYLSIRAILGMCIVDSGAGSRHTLGQKI